MSSNSCSGEGEAVNQLYSTIKAKFEQDGVLREIRCLLQSKMIAMMQGKNETTSMLQRIHKSPAQGDARMKLLHQLIMEYLNWHGFHYTAEMFAMESSSQNEIPMRQCVEGVLGRFERKDLPILLQLVANAWEKQNCKES